MSEKINNNSKNNSNNNPVNDSNDDVNYSIYISGVGGQGIIKTSVIIGEAAMLEGYDVVIFPEYRDLYNEIINDFFLVFSVIFIVSIVFIF